MEIRKAGLADIETISNLAHAIWPQAYGNILSEQQLNYMLDLIYSHSSLTNQIQKLQHNFIIVYDASAPVGFASFSPKSPADPMIFRLHKIYILPTQQGKGTGQFLLNHVIEQAKKSGAAILELNVNRQNKALHFYHKNGFSITREEDIDIGSGFFMNDYVMEKQL